MSPPNGRSTSDADRFLSLREMKEFAVGKGYKVPEKLIDDIVELEYKFRDRNKPSEWDLNDLKNLDRLTIALSAITYPVTACNVNRLGANSGITAFVYWLLIAGLVAAAVSGYFAWFIENGKDHQDWYLALAAAFLPMTLGIVGSIVYVLLPNGRLNVVAGIDAENIAMNIVRVGIGALLGFVFLYAARSLANKTLSDPIDPWTLFIPLMGGYSVSLVVGVLAKAVAAIQLALNIDEKSVRASLYR